MRRWGTRSATAVVLDRTGGRSTARSVLILLEEHGEGICDLDHNVSGNDPVVPREVGLVKIQVRMVKAETRWQT